MSRSASLVALVLLATSGCAESVATEAAATHPVVPALASPPAPDPVHTRPCPPSPVVVAATTALPRAPTRMGVMAMINAFRAPVLACMSDEGHGELRLMLDVRSTGIPSEVGMRSSVGSGDAMSDEARACVERALCGATMEPFALEHFAFSYPLDY